MLFVIDNLKYETEKMELVSEKVKKCVTTYIRFLDSKIPNMYDAKLYRSEKGRYLITWEQGYSVYAMAIGEAKAKELLLKYDYKKYEELFGELEEA